MSSEKSPSPLAPEEEELEKKRAQLAELEPILAEKELELATLSAGLKGFERRYLATVGAKYSQLDEIEAQLYEAAAKLVPADSEAQVKARAGREQAAVSAAQTRKSDNNGDSHATSFNPTENLKTLFRTLAKAVHPDLADGEEDCQRRHELMIRANEAYGKSDETALRAIMVEWQHSPEFVKGDSVAAELVRVIRKVARAQHRLIVIDQELKRLTSSELYLLKARVESAARSGRDLLEELAARIGRDIQHAQERLMQYQRSAT